MKLLITAWKTWLSVQCFLHHFPVLNQSSSGWHWHSQENLSSSTLTLFCGFLMYLSPPQMDHSHAHLKGLVSHSFPLFLVIVPYLLHHLFQDPSQSPPPYNQDSELKMRSTLFWVYKIYSLSHHHQQWFTLLIRGSMIEWKEVGLWSQASIDYNIYLNPLPTVYSIYQ